MAEYRNNSRIPEERNTTEARTRGQAWHFSLPSIFIRVQSYQSDEQVAKRILLKTFAGRKLYENENTPPFLTFFYYGCTAD